MREDGYVGGKLSYPSAGYANSNTTHAVEGELKEGVDEP